METNVAQLRCPVEISSRDVQYKKALFLCTIGQGALNIYNSFQYRESGDPDRVETLISKFEELFYRGAK